MVDRYIIYRDFERGDYCAFNSPGSDVWCFLVNISDGTAQWSVHLPAAMIFASYEEAEKYIPDNYNCQGRFGIDLHPESRYG
jgi:hypothetical protein